MARRTEAASRTLLPDQHIGEPVDTGNSFRRGIAATFALLFGAAAAFFLYYTVRLALVWRSARGGHPAGGAYIGLVAFPCAVLVFGLAARALARRARRR